MKKKRKLWIEQGILRRFIIKKILKLVYLEQELVIVIYHSLKAKNKYNNYKQWIDYQKEVLLKKHILIEDQCNKTKIIRVILNIRKRSFN